MSDTRHHSRNGFLTVFGLEHAQRTSLEGLDPRGVSEYVDSKGSVSGLELERDLYEIQTAKQLLEQSERFHNGP